MAIENISSVVLLCGLLASNSAMAASGSYQCKVKTELHLDNGGALKPFPRPLEVGKIFSVHRESGELIEATASFWSPNDAVTTVLSTGNAQNSFVVSYVAPSRGSGVHATVLQIEEFAVSKLKPFLLVSGSGVYSGTCQ